MNMSLWLPLWDTDFNSLEYIPKNGIVRSYGSSVFKFRGNSLQFCTKVTYYRVPPSVCQGSNAFTSSPTLAIFWVLSVFCLAYSFILAKVRKKWPNKVDTQVAGLQGEPWQMGGVGGVWREVKVGNGRVCSQGLSPSNLTKRGGRGGEFRASEDSRHLFLIFLSIYDFLPLPPSDSWGCLQPESPCGGKVLGKSPRRLQGFGAHFSLEKAQSRAGWWGLVKKAGLGCLRVLLLLCTVSGEWGQRVVFMCVHASRDGSDPCLPLSAGKTSNWLKLGSLVHTPWPRTAKTRVSFHEKVSAEPGLNPSSCSSLAAHRLHREVNGGREITPRWWGNCGQVETEQGKGDCEPVKIK